jgi:hypothetical protein
MFRCVIAIVAIGYFFSIPNIISSVCTEILFQVKYKINFPKYKGIYGTFPEIDDKTSAVMIMLSGMNSCSGQYLIHIDHVNEYNKNNDNQIKMFIPEVLDNGRNNLDKCGDKVFNSISEHLDQIIEKKINIFIIGISNGGRVGLYLYDKIMSKYDYDRLYISTLGSPLKGTYLANIAKMSRLIWLTHYRNVPYVLDEISYHSDTAMNLVEKCKKYKSFKTNTRFYVSKNDVMIFPYSCGLIEEHNNVIVEGIGHNGLVIYCHNDQLTWCYETIKANNNINYVHT